jgi:hypothetical protein
MIVIQLRFQNLNGSLYCSCGSRAFRAMAGPTARQAFRLMVNRSVGLGGLDLELLAAAFDETPGAGLRLDPDGLDAREIDAFTLQPNAAETTSLRFTSASRKRTLAPVVQYPDVRPVIAGRVRPVHGHALGLHAKTEPKHLTIGLAAAQINTGLYAAQAAGRRQCFARREQT